MKMPKNRMLRQSGGHLAVPLAIHGIPATSAEVGEPYGFTGYASGGQGPYVFTLVGSWPAGATIEGVGATFTVSWASPGADRVLTLVNPGFETGSMSGWTVSTANIEARSDVIGDDSPRTGTYYSFAGVIDNVNGNKLWQDFDVSADRAAIDAGLVSISGLACYHAQINTQGDNGDLVLEFYDADMVLIAGYYDVDTFHSGWRRLSIAPRTAPTGTDTIRLGGRSYIGVGPAVQSFFDDFESPTLTGVGGTYTGLTVRVTDAMGATADLATFTITVFPPDEAPAEEVDYPLGVSALHLEAVYDRRPGHTGSLTKSLPANTPAGCEIYAPLNWLYSVPFTETNFDASGYTIYANGGAFSLTNFTLHKDTANNSDTVLLGVGHVNGGAAGAQFTLTDGVVDGQSTAPSTGKVVVGNWPTPNGSTFTATRVSFENTREQTLFLIASSTLTNCYFEAAGQGGGAGHSENILAGHGTHVWTGLFFDARSTGPSASPTAQVFVDVYESGMTANVTFSNSILAGARAAGVPLAIAIGVNPGGTAIVRLNNLAIQKGTSDYVGNNGDVPGASRDVIASGCVDYDTGENIDDIINGRFPPL